jgi:amino acid transporter
LTLLIAVAGILLITGSTVTGSVENMQPLMSTGMAGMLSVLIMTPFMFVGFDVIPQAAEEINLPPRKVGKLLIFSVILAVVWYILIIFGTGYSLPADQIAGSTLATADAMIAAYGGSQVMGYVLIIGGIGGILTSWIAFYIGGSRALYAMARAGMLPKFLAKIHPKFNTPHRAILCIAVLSVGAPFLGRPALLWFVNAGGLALVVAWLLVSLSFIILRKHYAQLTRPFTLKGGTTIAWLAVAMTVGMVCLYMPGMPSALTGPEWIILGVWCVIGIALSVYSTRKYGIELAETELRREYAAMKNNYEHTAQVDDTIQA